MRVADLVGGEGLVEFEPTRRKVGDLLEALQALTHMDGHVTPPMDRRKYRGARLSPADAARETCGIADGDLLARIGGSAPQIATKACPLS